MVVIGVVIKESIMCYLSPFAGVFHFHFFKLEIFVFIFLAISWSSYNKDTVVDKRLLYQNKEL